jgi:PPM family protein phosphatase
VIFESLGVTDRGVRRRHNEDQFLVRDELTLYAVVDGMGGHAAGEVAADLAIREVERAVEATRDHEDATWPEDWDPNLSVNANRLVRAIVSAHRRITGAVGDDTALKGMGATIVAALLNAEYEQLTVAHVGDSRAYLYRDHATELITSDHSWVHEQVLAGLLSEEAARNHPLKNVVTRALGGAQEPTVDIVERPLAVDDLLLLCSDGLNTMLSDAEINTVLGRATDLREIASRMIREANRKGGVDNITVILVRVRP